MQRDARAAPDAAMVGALLLPTGAPVAEHRDGPSPSPARSMTGFQSPIDHFFDPCCQSPMDQFFEGPRGFPSFFGARNGGTAAAIVERSAPGGTAEHPSAAADVGGAAAIVGGGTLAAGVGMHHQQCFTTAADFRTFMQELNSRGSSSDSGERNIASCSSTGGCGSGGGGGGLRNNKIKKARGGGTKGSQTPGPIKLEPLVPCGLPQKTPSAPAVMQAAPQQPGLGFTGWPPQVFFFAPGETNVQNSGVQVPPGGMQNQLQGANLQLPMGMCSLQTSSGQPRMPSIMPAAMQAGSQVAAAQSQDLARAFAAVSKQGGLQQQQAPATRTGTSQATGVAQQLAQQAQQAQQLRQPLDNLQQQLPSQLQPQQQQKQQQQQQQQPQQLQQTQPPQAQSQPSSSPTAGLAGPSRTLAAAGSASKAPAAAPNRDRPGAVVSATKGSSRTKNATGKSAADPTPPCPTAIYVDLTCLKERLAPSVAVGGRAVVY